MKSIELMYQNIIISFFRQNFICFSCKNENDSNEEEEGVRNDEEEDEENGIAQYMRKMEKYYNYNISHRSDFFNKRGVDGGGGSGVGSRGT